MHPREQSDEQNPGTPPFDLRKPDRDGFASAAGLTTIYTCWLRCIGIPRLFIVGWAVTAYLLVSAVAGALGGASLICWDGGDDLFILVIAA